MSSFQGQITWVMYNTRHSTGTYEQSLDTHDDDNPQRSTFHTIIYLILSACWFFRLTMIKDGIDMKKDCFFDGDNNDQCFLLLVDSFHIHDDHVLLASIFFKRFRQSLLFSSSTIGWDRRKKRYGSFDHKRGLNSSLMKLTLLIFRDIWPWKISIFLFYWWWKAFGMACSTIWLLKLIEGELEWDREMRARGSSLIFSLRPIEHAHATLFHLPLFLPSLTEMKIFVPEEKVESRSSSWDFQFDWNSSSLENSSKDREYYLFINTNDKFSSYRSFLIGWIFSLLSSLCSPERQREKEEKEEKREQRGHFIFLFSFIFNCSDSLINSLNDERQISRQKRCPPKYLVTKNNDNYDNSKWK